MPEIKVRKAVLKDAEEIGKIAYQVAQLHYQKTKKEFKRPTLKNQTAYVRQSIGDENILVLTALCHHKISGYVIVYFNTYPDKYFQLSKRAFIGSIGVDELCRGQGVGRTLLNAVEKEVKKRHIKVIEVDYYSFNSSAGELYKHSGYEENKQQMRKLLKSF